MFTSIYFSELLKLMKAKIVLTAQDYTSIARRMLEESAINQKSLETQIALVGSVSQIYIDRNFAHYSQREFVTFQQCDMQQKIVEVIFRVMWPSFVRKIYCLRI